MWFNITNELRNHKLIYDSVARMGSVLVCGEAHYSPFRTAHTGVLLGSRRTQLRYICTTESKWNGSELDDSGTKNEMSALVKKHLDMPLILGIGRYVETLAHGEKAGSDSPLSLVASNTGMSNGDTLVEAEERLNHRVALSLSSINQGSLN